MHQTRVCRKPKAPSQSHERQTMPGAIHEVPLSAATPVLLRFAASFATLIFTAKSTIKSNFSCSATKFTKFCEALGACPHVSHVSHVSNGPLRHVAASARPGQLVSPGLSSPFGAASLRDFAPVSASRSPPDPMPQSGLSFPQFHAWPNKYQE